MNKGFAYYFRQAFRISAQTVWKNKNVIKSMTYFFMALVARITLVLGAMISLADVRQAKIAAKQRTVDIPQSLTRASQRSMWTMIVARVLEGLIYIGGFLMTSLVCGAIFAVGLVIVQFTGAEHRTLIYLIFAAPCLIIYLVYTIIVIAVFAPTAYVADGNPNLSAGDIVSICISSMKSRGKMTVILSVCVPYFFIALALGLCVSGFLIVNGLLAGQTYTLLLNVVWSVVSAVILALTVPVFTLVKNLSLVLLFEDIALDPVNASKKTAGINIKRITGAKIDREEIADNLDVLFEDGVEERTVNPEELLRKRKKKAKAKVKPVAQPVTVAEAKPLEEEEEMVFEKIDEYPEDAPANNTGAQDGQTEESGGESPKEEDKGE